MFKALWDVIPTELKETTVTVFHQVNINKQRANYFLLRNQMESPASKSTIRDTIPQK